MIKKFVVFMIISFLGLTYHVDAKTNNDIEIFCPEQNKVVKTIPITPEIRNMIVDWITNIEGIYVKLNPTVEDGYIIKIPLDPVENVQGNCINEVVNEVYIMLPEKDMPFYMISNNGDELTFYQFNGNVKFLSEMLDFNLARTP